MSYEDQLERWLTEEGNNVFSLVTVNVKRKIKVQARLEDADGEEVDLQELVKNLLDYIVKHIENGDATPVNSQIFPIVSTVASLFLPLYAGDDIATRMVSSALFRNAFAYQGILIMLFTKYIQQHNLKIVTEEFPITDEELAAYQTRNAELEQELEIFLNTKKPEHD